METFFSCIRRVASTRIPTHSNFVQHTSVLIRHEIAGSSNTNIILDDYDICIAEENFTEEDNCADIMDHVYGNCHHTLKML